MRRPSIFEIRKRFIFRIGSIILIFHFFVLMLFGIPDHWLPDPIVKFCNTYTYPLFYQKWNLFAPNPPLKHKTMLYKTEKSTEWIDPAARFKIGHDTYRISYHTKMYHTIQNCAHYLWTENFDQNNINSAEKFGVHFESAVYLCTEHFKKNEGEGPKSIALCLAFSSPQRNSDGNIIFVCDSIFFPVKYLDK